MRTVTERLVGRVAAAAETDRSPAAEVKRLALRIDDLKITLDADRAVAVDRDFRCRHQTSGFLSSRPGIFASNLEYAERRGNSRGHRAPCARETAVSLSTWGRSDRLHPTRQVCHPSD